MDFSSTFCRGSASPRRSASGRFLPTLLAGALARGEPRPRLRRHGLRVPGGARGSCSRSSSWWPSWASSTPARARSDAVARRWCCVAIAVVLGALLARGLARRPQQHVVARADRRRRRRGARWASRPRARCSPASRARLDAEAAGALPLYAEGAALLAAGLSILLPPLAHRHRRRARVAAARRPPPRGREVRRPADPPVKRRLAQRARVARSNRPDGDSPGPGDRVTKKLVLAVIDAMKPAMLERAVATGRAPTLAALIERGQHVDDCVAAFPSVTPVCAASIATGTGPGRARDPVDELVPPRRGALRRVRDELRRQPRRSGSSSRSPTRSTT